LRGAGLIVKKNGLYLYAPSTDALDDSAQRVEKLYAIRDIALIRAILAYPHDKFL